MTKLRVDEIAKDIVRSQMNASTELSTLTAYMAGGAMKPELLVMELWRNSRTISAPRLSSTWLYSEQADDWIHAGQPSGHAHSFAMVHALLSIFCGGRTRQQMQQQRSADNHDSHLRENHHNLVHKTATTLALLIKRHSIGSGHA